MTMGQDLGGLCVRLVYRWIRVNNDFAENVMYRLNCKFIQCINVYNNNYYYYYCMIYSANFEDRVGGAGVARWRT